MKIVHVVQKYPPAVGGSEEIVRQWSERLAKRGHEVYVLAKGVQQEERNGVFLWPVESMKQYRQQLDYYTRIADIIMVFGQKVWCSDQLPLANIHCPLVYWPCGFSHWGKTPWHWVYYNWWQKKVCNKADVIVAATQGEQNFLESYINDSVITRIPFGVDYDYWQEPADTDYQPIEGPFAFCGGGYYPNKRVWDLVASLLYTDAQLVTCGPSRRPGGSKSLETYAIGLGVEDRLHAYKVPPPFLFKWFMQNCSVYVSASDFEGFGLTFLEALACGKPIVSRAVGAIPELIEIGEIGTDPFWGISVNANTHEGIATGIDFFLQNKWDEERSRDIARRYDWETIIDQVEDLYTGLA